MIDRLYGKYFQKSRSFLYPALGIIKNQPYGPAGTYISLPGKYGAEDMKLLCSFESLKTADFIEFEHKMLTSNPLYYESFQIAGYNIYVFDFEIYQSDWFQFLTGRYSKLSSTIKKAIRTYYGENSPEYRHIQTYLFPEKYFELYAKLLDVDVDDLKSVGELCDPWSMELETLKYPVEYLESLQKQL